MFRLGIRISLMVGFVLGLCACSNMIPQPLASKTVIPTADPSMVVTAEAASSISQSISQMELASRNDQGMLKRESGEKVPQVLTRLMTIDWAGPVEPLVKQIASATQLRVKVLGSAPAIPVTVSLRLRDTMAYDILQDMRSQINNRADILIFPTSGVIELRYM